MPLKFDSSVLLFLAVVFSMMIIVKLLRARSRTVVKIMLQFVLGGVFILIFNYLGKSYDISIPLNPLTSFIAGILQLPGVALLLVVKYVIYA